jgi:hypothetical protein
VFALLRDGATWPTWSPVGSFDLERATPDGGEGTGAIRRFRTGLTTSREGITGIEADRCFGYRALSGLPISDHRATVKLEAERGGTTIVWSEEFRTIVPGMRWFLRTFVRRSADGLAARAAADQAAERAAQ